MSFHYSALADGVHITHGFHCQSYSVSSISIGAAVGAADVEGCALFPYGFVVGHLCLCPLFFIYFFYIYVY